MKIVGIVSEYNPFHKGHEYHIQSVRGSLGYDTGIVCVMSGNFVQRGEPAIFEKHARALAAVLCGADLVLELPIPYVLSSAEGFSSGAIKILNSLKCVNYISFGSEAGDIEELLEIARILLDPELDEFIKCELKLGVSYPQARQKAAERLSDKKLDLLKSPNNILGIEYIKALIHLNSNIQPITLKRIGAGHDKSEVSEGIASASLLRKRVQEGLDIHEYIPEGAFIVFREEIENGFAPVFTGALETSILAKLRTMPPEKFKALPDATEGLGERLMKYARTEKSVEDIIGAVKTKRYTYSRVKRMLMCAYLDIDTSMRQENPPYARVLACNERGKEILRKTDVSFPVITKPAGVRKFSRECIKMFEVEANATDLYVLAFPDTENRAGGQEWVIGPEII